MPYSIYVKTALLGLLTLPLAFTLLALWLERRTPARRLRQAALGVALALLAVALLPPYGEAWLDEAAVQAAAAELVPGIERYRAQRGEYPPSLAAAGLRAPRTRFGPMRYRRIVEEGQPRFSLSVGDYGRHGFVYAWQSNWPPNRWYLDT